MLYWGLLSILQLKVLNLFRDRRQHILAIIIRQASLHFVKHCDYLFQTHAFLFQLVVLVIAPVIIGISSTWSLAISGFWIALTLFSLTRCRQLISNSLIIGSDAGIFSSKLVYSAADISLVNSFKRASNSKSSSSSISISSLSPLMPHFLKQFLVVKLVTSFHASCSHRIVTSTSTPLTICVADTSSWILASTYLTSLFRYLTL